jgi:hypothetical protein
MADGAVLLHERRMLHLSFMSFDIVVVVTIETEFVDPADEQPFRSGTVRVVTGRAVSIRNRGVRPILSGTDRVVALRTEPVQGLSKKHRFRAAMG